MARDEAEAETWAKATRGEILGKFMPRHVRRRTPRPFRPEQYATHCDRGGHPNPAGADLVQLRLGSSQLEGLWADLAQHAAETWDEFCLGLTRYDPRRQVGDQLYSPWRSPEEGAAVADTLARWRSQDPLLRVQVMPPGS